MAKPQEPTPSELALSKQLSKLRKDVYSGQIYHWTTRRIHGHVVVCLLAFALKKLLFRRLKESQPKLEYPQVRADLDRLKMLKLSVNGRDHLLRTELQGSAYAPFRAVGSCPPPRVTELEPPKSAQM